MAEIKNKELRTTYLRLKTLQTVIEKFQDEINRGFHNLKKVVPGEIQGQFKEKADALKYYDQVIKTSSELCLIELWGTFEWVLFNKYKLTSGKISRFLDELKEPMDFPNHKGSFVIEEPHTVKPLLEIAAPAHAPNAKRVHDLSDFRSYLAHGKRFHSAATFPGTLEEAALLLDEVISRIEKKV